MVLIYYQQILHTSEAILVSVIAWHAGENDIESWVCVRQGLTNV